MSRASRVPRDDSMAPEVRTFLDGLSRASDYVGRDGTANYPILKEDGKRVFVQYGVAEDGGLSHVPYNHGTVTSGTVVIDPSVRLHHELICGGAITISPAATDYHGTVLLHITNNSAAGDKTMSGFTFAQPGSSFTNTDGHKFWVALFFAGADGCDYRVQKRQA